MTIECDDIMKEFIVECCEGLDCMDRDLVALEQDPSSTEILGQIFRTIHTIKGSSGFLALPKLESIAHVGENLLSLLRDGKRALDVESTSALLEMADAIREILSKLEHGKGEGDTDYSHLVTRLAHLTQESAEEQPASPAAQPVTPTATTEQHAQSEAHHEPTTTKQDAMASSQQTQSSTSGGGASDAPKQAISDSTIRVDVKLLDTLMNLVGELVLARNQVLQFTTTHDDPSFIGTSQRLNLVTTELQEGIMKTRMQPVGSIWTKFPRVVRDLSISCNKKVRIEMEGEDTELDKTIVESIKDPLTHAIRNSVDHGIESQEARQAVGKPVEGCIRLRAYHEGGMVNIEITDDGAGIDPEKVRAKAIKSGIVTADRAARMSQRELVNLITLPGFSTAEQVSNVSGRGVGMDVVKTNIEKVGGTIDIQSVVGKGTTLKIKIPLTLAIIPALIVTSHGNRYAIPQVNLLELVRLDGNNGSANIEYIHGAPIYRLRGNLLPLLYLDRELGKPRSAPGEGTAETKVANIVVLQADDRQFGLVVESILDTEEIVVKPLGRQLKGISRFAGAAIMGDGLVALILDVMGLAQAGSIISNKQKPGDVAAAAEGSDTTTTKEALLLIAVGSDGRAAIELPMVARLEEFEQASIEHAAGQEVTQYRDAIMPIVRLDAVLGEPSAHDPTDRMQVVVVNSKNGRQVGLAVNRIVDIIEIDLNIERHSARSGIRGSAIVQGVVTDLLDIESIITNAVPGFLEKYGSSMEAV